MKHSVKEIIKGTTANLAYCQGGKLFYSVVVEDLVYTFPVDVSNRDEVGDGVFELEHKAITLMRYIRMAIKTEEIRWAKD